jgi:hypothetical protein
VIEEIIGRLPELIEAQIGRFENEIQRERKCRASSEGGERNLAGLARVYEGSPRALACLRGFGRYRAARW